MLDSEKTWRRLYDDDHQQAHKFFSRLDSTNQQES